MKNRIRLFKRALAGVGFILLAAFCTIIIRDAVALQNPDKSIPEIRIFYNETQVPVAHPQMASYNWRFLFQLHGGGRENPENYHDIPPAWIPPAAALRVEFSTPCKNVTVWRAAEDGVFTQMPMILVAPAQAGLYTYRIEADWGFLGNATYYFRMNVPQY